MTIDLGVSLATEAGVEHRQQQGSWIDTDLVYARSASMLTISKQEEDLILMEGLFSIFESGVLN